MNYSGLLVQVHGLMLQSYARAERIQQSSYVMINSQWCWSVDDVMPRRDGPENLRILKGSSWIFRIWSEQIFWGLEMNWDAPRLVSICFLWFVSLSSCRQGLNPFVSETTVRLYLYMFLYYCCYWDLHGYTTF